MFIVVVVVYFVIDSVQKLFDALLFLKFCIATCRCPLIVESKNKIQQWWDV